MTLIFYDYDRAPSPRRARILLAEKNVPHETVQIDMMKNAQLSDEYRAINPACTIPALKLEDGTVLTDNAGIAAYLEHAFPHPPLLGTTAVEKAEVASWNAKLEGAFLMGIASAFRNTNPAMKNRALPGPHDYAQIPALADRGMAQIDHFLAMFESHLEGREFIAADHFTVADVTGGVTLDFARVVGKRPGEEHRNIARWHAGLKERPSFQL